MIYVICANSFLIKNYFGKGDRDAESRESYNLEDFRGESKIYDLMWRSGRREFFRRLGGLKDS